MQVNAGLRSLNEEEVLAIRRQGAEAIQAIYVEMGFPAIGDGEVDAAVLAHSSDDMPERDFAFSIWSDYMIHSGL